MSNEPEQLIITTEPKPEDGRLRHEIPLSSALLPRRRVEQRTDKPWMALARAEHETDVIREVLAELINRLSAEPGISIKYADLLAKLNTYN